MPSPGEVIGLPQPASERRQVSGQLGDGIYEEIDLSEWIGGNPLDVLATNFGVPASAFEKFPRSDVFISEKNGS